METCTVEVGLLKKKPCGHPSVTHCQTCEQPLCKDHAVAQTNEAGHKTGKFMCKECDAARREFEKTQAKLPQPAAKKVMNGLAELAGNNSARKISLPL